jgi:hypothetical protein
MIMKKDAAVRTSAGKKMGLKLDKNNKKKFPRHLSAAVPGHPGVLPKFRAGAKSAARADFLSQMK